MSRIQAVRGMNDILPSQTVVWEQVISALSKCLKQYAFGEVKLPLIESTSLFKRTIGEVTDIVE